ncbi:MAG TPA: SGNH/GDSL hydrolase family protein [Pyrinomonadaceae bacterium]|nr:SGNH/GDSL hydrolase family protein [Pyrinomonadaceae bacterium]
MTSHSPSRKNFLRKLLLVLFGLLLGAIIAEIVLRVAGYSYPGFYMPDEIRGHSLIPNREGWYRKEGQVFVRINSDGLRDREHTKSKPAGTIRIAVLGDSHAEALQVSVEQAFWAVVEQKLRSCERFAGKQVEVINFGVSGYGAAQELLTLREKVWDYSPDIVLLAVTTNNDITDNSRALKKTDEAPYFVFREGKLLLDDSFRSSRAFQLRQSRISRLGRWIKDHSRLLQAVNEGHHGFKILLASWRSRRNSSETAAPEKGALVNRSDELGTDNLIYTEPANPTWEEAWRVTEGLIVSMRDEVKAKGAEFAVMTLSNGPQVLPDPAARQAYMQRFGIKDLFYPDNRIRQFCLRENIPVITLAPELQSYAEHEKVFLHGFGSDIGNGHWNVAGHAVAGELLAQKLCQGVFNE